MNELKFNSQTCTNEIQSQRLLDLGLKPETADMVYTDASLPYKKDEFRLICKEYLQLHKEVNYEISPFTFIPAWSLHRLISMCPHNYDFTINSNRVLYRNSFHRVLFSSCQANLFDAIIDIIEYLIKDNHFNKEYLKQ